MGEARLILQVDDVDDKESGLIPSRSLSAQRRGLCLQGCGAEDLYNRRTTQTTSGYSNAVRTATRCRGGPLENFRIRTAAELRRSAAQLRTRTRVGDSCALNINNARYRNA